MLPCTRSHPQILALPNELFYANELEALADPELVGNMCSWEHIPAVLAHLTPWPGTTRMHPMLLSFSGSYGTSHASGSELGCVLC